MRYHAGLVLLIAAAGCSVFGPSIADQLNDAEQLPGPVFYVGDEFQELPLTDVLAGADDGVRANEATFIYGDCKPEPDAGCAPPLEIQNAVCDEGTRIVIWADTTALGQRAKQRLRTVDGSAAQPYEVRFDRDTPCGDY